MRRRVLGAAALLLGLAAVLAAGLAGSSVPGEQRAPAAPTRHAAP